MSCGGELPARWVLWVWFTHDSIGESEVVQTGCHRSVDADAEAQGFRRLAGDAAVAGLQTVEAAEGGGDADRATAVGAEGDRDQAAGDGEAGSS